MNRLHISFIGALFGLALFFDLARGAISPLQESEPQTTYESSIPKSGERCLICKVPLSQEDTVLMVRGRRVPLKAAMVDSFMKNQEKYFAQMQPKSALFQENLEAPDGFAQGGISLGWFIFGSYILVALIFSGLSGYAAVSKGLPPIPNYFIGFFFSVLGYLYVLSRPAAVNRGKIPEGLVKVPDTNAPATCPNCGNANHPSAGKCAQCGSELNPEYESEVSRA